MKSLIQVRNVGGRRFAGVEYEAKRTHIGLQRAFEFDGFGQRSRVGRKRMPAARFRETLDQRLGFGVEVQETHGKPGRAQLVDHHRKRGEARFRPDVETDRDVPVTRALQIGHCFREERQGQIVDRVIAGILERRECHAFAGARNPTDQQQVHGEERLDRLSLLPRSERSEGPAGANSRPLSRSRFLAGSE
jgi:hypothetical protein